MTHINLSNLDKHVRKVLQDRAAEHGRSIEEEVREILTNSVQQVQSNGTSLELGSEIAARFRECALDQPIPELRGHEARPADLDS